MESNAAAAPPPQAAGEESMNGSMEDAGSGHSLRSSPSHALGEEPELLGDSSRDETSNCEERVDLGGVDRDDGAVLPDGVGDGSPFPAGMDDFVPPPSPSPAVPHSAAAGPSAPVPSFARSALLDSDTESDRSEPLPFTCTMTVMRCLLPSSPSGSRSDDASSGPRLSLAEFGKSEAPLFGGDIRPVAVDWLRSEVSEGLSLRMLFDVDGVRIRSSGYPFSAETPMSFSIAMFSRQPRWKECLRFRTPESQDLRPIYIGRALSCDLIGYAVVRRSMFKTDRDFWDAIVRVLQADSVRATLGPKPMSSSFLRGQRLLLSGTTAKSLFGLLRSSVAGLEYFHFQKFDTKSIGDPAAFTDFASRTRTRMDAPELEIVVDLGLNLSLVSDQCTTSTFWRQSHHSRVRKESNLISRSFHTYPCFCSGIMENADFIVPAPSMVSKVKFYAAVSHMFRRLGCVPFTTPAMPARVLKELASRNRFAFADKDVKAFEAAVSAFDSQKKYALDCIGEIERTTTPARAEFTLCLTLQDVREGRLGSLEQDMRQCMNDEKDVIRSSLAVYDSQHIAAVLRRQVNEASAALVRMGHYLASDRCQRSLLSVFVASTLEDRLRFLFDGQRHILRSMAFAAHNHVLDGVLDRGCLSLDVRDWTVPETCQSAGRNPLRLKTAMLFHLRGRLSNERALTVYDVGEATRYLSFYIRAFPEDPAGRMRSLESIHEWLCRIFVDDLRKGCGAPRLLESALGERGWTLKAHAPPVDAMWIFEKYVQPLLAADKRVKSYFSSESVFRAALLFLERHPSLPPECSIQRPEVRTMFIQRLDEVFSSENVQAFPVLDVKTLRTRTRAAEGKVFVRYESAARRRVGHPHAAIADGDGAPEEPRELDAALNGPVVEVGLEEENAQFSLADKKELLEFMAVEALLDSKAKGSFIRFALSLWEGHYDNKLKNNIDVAAIESTRFLRIDEAWKSHTRHRPEDWVRARRTDVELLAELAAYRQNAGV